MLLYSIKSIDRKFFKFWRILIIQSIDRNRTSARMASQIARRVLRRGFSGRSSSDASARVFHRSFAASSNLIRATLFPGDGIGPEIAESVKQVRFFATYTSLLCLFPFCMKVMDFVFVMIIMVACNVNWVSFCCCNDLFACRNRIVI